MNVLLSRRKDPNDFQTLRPKRTNVLGKTGEMRLRRFHKVTNPDLENLV